MKQTWGLWEGGGPIKLELSFLLRRRKPQFWAEARDLFEVKGSCLTLWHLEELILNWWQKFHNMPANCNCLRENCLGRLWPIRGLYEELAFPLAVLQIVKPCKKPTQWQIMEKVAILASPSSARTAKQDKNRRWTYTECWRNAPFCLLLLEDVSDIK